MGVKRQNTRGVAPLCSSMVVNSPRRKGVEVASHALGNQARGGDWVLRRGEIKRDRAQVKRGSERPSSLSGAKGNGWCDKPRALSRPRGLRQEGHRFR